jgi:hypothetical protein
MYRQMLGKKYYLPIVIVIVIVVSCVGVLDEYSESYTDASISKAGVTYAIARGINGIVSVLQTGTAQAGVGVSGSIAFGEVLDPINDLIERFSHVMSLALGSLVLQKVLLGISAHGVFKLLIGVFGFTLIAAFLFNKIAVIAWVSRIFVILIFIRFALVMVVSFNSIVDNFFLSQKITSGTEELREFRNDVINLKDNSGKLDIDHLAYEESIRNDRLNIDEINDTLLPSINLELVDANDQLIEAKKALDEIHIGRIGRLIPFKKNKKAKEAKQRVSSCKQQVAKLKKRIKANENLVEQLRKEIANNEKRLAGKPVGTWAKIKNKLPSIGGLKRRLDLAVIGENLTGTVNNIFNLSVLFVLKTILIPIAFLFLFIKGVKGIWKADLTGVFSDEEKLATA